MANVTIQKNTPPKQQQPAPQREVATWDPLRMMRTLFEWDPFREMAPIGVSMPTFSPAFDIKETSDGYTFAADLPGMKESDVEVSMAGNRLSISGKRETEKEEKGERYYSCERSFGSFLRSFTLPEDADVANVSASMKDGVLTIAIPKKAEAQAKKIPIGEKKP